MVEGYIGKLSLLKSSLLNPSDAVGLKSKSTYVKRSQSEIDSCELTTEIIIFMTYIRRRYNQNALFTKSLRCVFAMDHVRACCVHARLASSDIHNARSESMSIVLTMRECIF